MNSTNPSHHRVLLQWLVGAGVVLLAFYIAFREGLFTLLINSDRSFLSIVILVAFALINLHVIYRVFVISSEHNVLLHFQELLIKRHSFSCNEAQQLICCGQIQPPSYISRHVKNLIARLAVEQSPTETANLQTHLLNALEKRIVGGHKYGWMLADLMIKLGLVGTVVGFTIMLGSVATLEHYDMETMQDLLHRMSGGMRVALFTTLTGLLSGLLLAVQYQFLDYHADALLAEIEELAEVHIIPSLISRDA